MFNVKFPLETLVIARDEARQQWLAFHLTDAITYNKSSDSWYDAVLFSDVPAKITKYSYPLGINFVKEFLDGQWVISVYMIAGRTSWRVVDALTKDGCSLHDIMVLSEA